MISRSYRAALRCVHLTGKTSVLDTPNIQIRDRANVYRWVQDHDIATRNLAGRAVRLVGAVSDIAIRKNAEQALRDSEEALLACHECNPMKASTTGM